MGSRRQQRTEHHEPAGEQCGDQRLHALDADPGGDLADHLGQRWVPGRLRREVRGALAHLVGEQDLAARWRDEFVRVVDGSLVGDGERAQRCDAVAVELDADGMLRGGREHVDNAAAHGDLAALLDQVDPGVCEVDQPVHGLAQVGGLPRLQPHGRDLPEIRGHRLDEGTHGGDDDGGRAGRMLLRMRDPAKHRDAAADGVRARREPFVRKGFPGREHLDPLVADEVTDRRRGRLGFSPGGGDEADRHAGATGVDRRSERRGDERAQSNRAGDADHRLAGVGHEPSDERIPQCGGEESAQPRRLSGTRLCRTDPMPACRAGAVISVESVTLGRHRTCSPL